MKNVHLLKALVFATAVGCVALSSFRLQAATLLWTNAASGGWSTAANWSPNSVPGTNDTAVITNAGVTVSLSVATGVGGIILGTNGPGTVTLELASQTLTLNGPLTVNPSGSFTLDSGTLLGYTNAVLRGTVGWTAGTLGGVLTLASNSTVNITTANNHYIPGSVFTNFGTVNWSGGFLYAGGGSVFYNYGLWNAQDDQQLQDYYGGAGAVFNNYGTFRKSGGTSEFATATIFNPGVVFNQLAGVLDVQNGTNGLEVALEGGGNFTGGYITTNQFGLTVLSTGSFNVNGTVTGTNTWADIGTLVGTNVISGALTWVGGVWNSTVVTVTSNSVLYINSAANHYLGGCLFTNFGTVNWSGGFLYSGNGAVFYNYGLWNAQDDQQLQDYYGGAGAIFNNYGTFRKSGGTSEFATATILTSGVLFNQLAGVIDVQNGTNGLELAFQGGANFTGGYITTNQYGLTVLNNGNFNLNGTVTGTNTWADTGTLVGTNIINGGLTWVGGVWNNTVVTVVSNSVLNINSTPNHYLGGCLFTNFGTVNWSGGILYAGSGSVCCNYGLWNAQDDQQFQDYYGGAGAVFDNYGIFRKSGGASEFANATIFASGAVFNQLAGAIDVQNGTNGLELAFQGGGHFTGGYITTNASGLTVLSEGNFTLNGTLTGTNTWEDAGNLAGTNVINGFLTWVAGTWNGAVVSIAPNSTVLIIGGTGNNDMNASVVTNYGTLAWASGAIRSGNGAEIYNYGLWNCQSDQTLSQSAYGGAIVTFNNYGTLRKSGGGPEFTNATYFASGVLFNQLAGVIDVQNSTNGLQLDFQGGGNFTGGYITTNQFGLTVLSLGSFNLNGTVTGTNTWEDAGNLVGTDVILGNLTWLAGTWNGATSVTISANSGVLALGGAGNLDLVTVVTNSGVFSWASGSLRGGTGAIIDNYGVWNCQSDQQINDAYGGTVVFNNYGTLRKSGGAGEFVNNTIFEGGVVFNQLAGVIDVQNSTNGLQLAFLGGGSLTGGYVTTNTQGLLNLAGGNFNLNGTVTDTNTWLNGANLAGTNVIQGALTWYAGTWNPSYFVTIATNSMVIVAGSGNMDFNGVVVTNSGTVLWANGTLRGGGATVVDNYGLWNAQSDQIFNAGYGAGTVFNNFGTLRKSGGGPEFTNATYFANGVLFNQLAGAIDVQNGTNGLQLDFQGGGNFTGGYITTNQFGLTVLNAGNFNLNGTVTGTNTWEDAGNLAGTNVLQGALTWLAGNWNPSYSVTIAANSTLIAAGGGNELDFNGVMVTNNGTVAWSSGTLRGGGATRIFNNGVWNAQSDQILNAGYGAGTVFNNPGTFIKTAGTNNGAGTQIQNGVTFNNSGRLDCQAGVISLQGGYSLTNGTLNFGINSRTNYGEIGLAGAAVLTGTVSANLNNGYIPVEGNSFTNLYYGSYTGIFTNAVLPFADAWTTNYFPTYFVLTVVNSRPVFAAFPTNTFYVPELTSLNVTNSATDGDFPAQTLTYSLIAGTNGMAVNSATGVFTWTPQPTNSPSTNVVSVAVTDNGTPSLSATNTFTVIVLEVNQAPILGVLGTQTLTLLQPFFLANSATEPNPHATTAGYILLSPPAGASISAGGLIAWTPAASQTLTTNTITTVVTNSDPYDLVNPHLSATNSFLAIVLPNTIKTNLSVFVTNGTFHLNWPADHTGWRIESQTNSLTKGLGTNWVAATGSAATNQLVVPVAKTNGLVLFRMVYP